MSIIHAHYPPEGTNEKSVGTHLKDLEEKFKVKILGFVFMVIDFTLQIWILLIFLV